MNNLLLHFLVVFLGCLSSAGAGTLISEAIDQRNGYLDTRSYYADAFAPTIYRSDLAALTGRPMDENIICRHTLSVKNKLIYDVEYKLGKYGFRIQPSQNLAATKHFIIAGDSNIFGIGVKDNETASVLIEKACSECKTYNWGIPGGAPNHHLVLSEKENLFSEIHEDKGVMVYFIQSFLIERTINSFRFFQWDHGLSPCFDRNLKHEGNFNECDSTKNVFYKALDFLNLPQWLFPNFPRITQEDVEFSFKMIAKIKKQYLTRFPKGRFLLMPLYSVDPFFTRDQVRPLAKKLNLEIIEPNMNLYKKENQIEGDEHFNSEGHKALAEIILLKDF